MKSVPYRPTFNNDLIMLTKNLLREPFASLSFCVGPNNNRSIVELSIDYNSTTMTIMLLCSSGSPLNRHCEALPFSCSGFSMKGLDPCHKDTYC